MLKWTSLWEVALKSFTGTFTRPKLMAPLQIDLAMLGAPPLSKVCLSATARKRARSSPRAAGRASPPPPCRYVNTSTARRPRDWDHRAETVHFRAFGRGDGSVKRVRRRLRLSRGRRDVAGPAAAPPQPLSQALVDPALLGGARGRGAGAFLDRQRRLALRARAGGLPFLRLVLDHRVHLAAEEEHQPGEIKPQE